jgi:hypothetical protein
VILSLVDGSGTPVLDGNGKPRTTSSLADGTYSFGSLPPGTYGVVQTQPGGFVSLSDKDGGDLDEIRPIMVTSGQTNTLNDFVEISRCPDTWADWKQLHPTENAVGNPDADDYDNFAEFAFAMPYDNGSGSPWLGNTAWIIRPSTMISGAIEGVFVRPKGAPLNVTYTLQYAAVAGNPTAWQSVVIATGGASPNAIAVDNGDCTDTITIIDLETTTGLLGGTGVVRIQAELDDDGGHDEVDHTSFTETEGWTETGLELCCRTYNNPYLREAAFTGTISAVSGQNLTFATSGGGGLDLAHVLAPGVSYFIEVTSGDRAGHRFDIVSGSGNMLTLAADSNIHSATAPFNTLAGAPPLDLAGDTVALRRHWTLNEVFPPGSFGATSSQSIADQVQIFADGAWTIYWLFDLSASDQIPARWVDVADGAMADRGATVIPSGQGVFFNNRNHVTSLLSYGEIRENRFVRPLAPGSNLVGGGYPVDQSPDGGGSQPLDLGRAMNLSAGFVGNRDFKIADSIFVWRADATITAKGYDTFFFVNGAPALPSLLRWVRVGDASLSSFSATPFLLGNRSVFVRTRNELPQYTIPLPWTL